MLLLIWTTLHHTRHCDKYILCYYWNKISVVIHVGTRYTTLQDVYCCTEARLTFIRRLNSSRCGDTDNDRQPSLCLGRCTSQMLLWQKPFFLILWILLSWQDGRNSASYKQNMWLHDCCHHNLYFSSIFAAVMFVFLLGAVSTSAL